MTKHMHFQYDPVNLSRLLLQIRMENKYNGNEEVPKSLRFAIFEFLRTTEDDEFETVIRAYADAENVDEITLEEHDLARLEHHLLQNKCLNQMRWNYQQDGTDGMGVLDLSRKTFTPCGFVQHGDTLKAILKAHHGNYGEAYEYIMFGGRREYAGIKAGELIAYIRKNFKFIDTQRQVDQLEPSR